MRVLVAGATGVLGRALLPQLKTAGHEVYGLARTPEKLLQIDTLGAKVVRGDVLDADRMKAVMAEVQPEAIVNLATAMPLKLRINPKDWLLNDRVRVEGTANLVSAAKETNLRLFVQASVGYVCTPQGDGWLDETTPRTDHPFLKATRQMEDSVLQSGLPATLLRFAALTAADSWHTQQSIAALRRGMLPIIGSGDFFISIIHTEDAARAIVCALAKPEIAAGEIFNVVDDEPARMRKIFPYAAKLLHASPPRTVPLLMAKMVAGALTIEIFTESYRMQNAKIKARLAFVPKYPTYRESWAQIAAEVGGKDFAPSEDLK